MANRSQVHPDLMGAPGGQAAFDERGRRRQGLEHRVARERGLAAALEHRHLLAVSRVAADIAGDFAPARRGHTPDHRHVDPGDAVRGQLGGKAGVGGVVLGHHHQPAGVLVQPVHDPRTAHPADARE